jgi:hypothetical protein
VGTTSLDDYCREKRISSLRLIKIDAEGAELNLLRGAGEVLDRIRPEAVICEFAPVLLADARRSWTRLLAAFSSHGYSLRRLDLSGTPKPRDPGLPSWDWGNVCFVPDAAGETSKVL